MILCLISASLAFLASYQVNEVNEEWTLLVEALRSDGIRFNALNAYSKLIRMIPENPPGLREKLESLMDDRDYQLRMFATELLVRLYRERGIPESKWPEALIRNLVEGLRDDRIYYGNTFSNATNFFQYLYELKENRPIDLLVKELKGTDPQSRFAGVILLARYGASSAREDVNKELLRYLLDDGIFENAFVAYQMLIQMGPENTRRIVKEFEPKDWQQAAFIQIMTGYHGISWSPPDRIRKIWLEKISSPSFTPYSFEPKLARAALYIDPQGERFLKDKAIPESMRRMLRAGRGVHGQRERAKWVFTWFPVLKPDEREGKHQASLVIFVGESTRL